MKKRERFICIIQKKVVTLQPKVAKTCETTQTYSYLGNAPKDESLVVIEYETDY